MSTIAGIVAPIFAPLGFGNWRAVAALISGVAAKETVISVLTALGGIGAALDSPLAAASFSIVTCLYVPCVATIAAVGKELGGKSAALSVIVQTAVAYVVSLAAYRSGRLFEYDKRLFFTVLACVAVVCAAIVIVARIKRVKRKRAENGVKRNSWEKNTR